MKFFKKLNNKGFGHIEALIIVLALVIIGGVYALIEHSHALICVTRVDNECVGVVEYTNDPPSTAMSPLTDIEFGAANKVPYTIQTCYSNGQLTVRWTVDKQAGKDTVQHAGALVAVYAVGPTGYKRVYVTRITNRGYNPIAVVQTGPKQAVQHFDNWKPESSSLSVQDATVTGAANGQFKAGILGEINNTPTYVWSAPTTGGQWYQDTAMDKCTT